jgi:hypothetical protein
MHEGALALIDPRHETAERLGEGEQDAHIKSALDDEIGGHEKSSGLNSAHTRYTAIASATMVPMT